MVADQLSLLLTATMNIPKSVCGRTVVKWARLQYSTEWSRPLCLLTMVSGTRERQPCTCINPRTLIYCIVRQGVGLTSVQDCI